MHAQDSYVKVDLPINPEAYQGLNIAVFASGRGSNLRAIGDAICTGIIRNARIALVLSNNASSGALQYAREQNIPAVHLSRAQFDTTENFMQKLLQVLEENNINFIALAGYMKKLDAAIITKYQNRILNIHPALLPDFGGKGMYGNHVHEAVIASGATYSGATVHLVDEEYDRGPVILQERVDIEPGDTPESLAQKVLQVEHRLFPQAIKLFAEGKINIHNRLVEIAHA